MRPPEQDRGARAKAESRQVTVPTHVLLELVTAAAETELLEFDLVPDDEADFSAGFLGAGTPLGRAILGAGVGSEVEYRAADVVAVRILEVSAAERMPPTDLAAERQAVIRRAVSRSNLTDAQRLALTVDVKWGDYDPDGIEANWTEEAGEAE